MVSDVTSSSITVQWDGVPCIHHNGDITGYSVQYGVAGSQNTQNNISVSGATKATISNLRSGTNYWIKIAAVNSIGTGPFSEAVSKETLVEGKYLD